MFILHFISTVYTMFYWFFFMKFLKQFLHLLKHRNTWELEQRILIRHFGLLHLLYVLYRQSFLTFALHLFFFQIMWHTSRNPSFSCSFRFINGFFRWTSRNIRFWECFIKKYVQYWIIHINVRNTCSDIHVVGFIFISYILRIMYSF